MARLLAFALLFVASLAASAAETGATAAVRNVLSTQQDAWNRGDIVGFMKGYWQSEDIRFAGGDGFTYGWQATLRNYQKRYPDAATMGKLDFDLVEVREITPEIAYVFGKWHLTRASEPADKAPHGLFTLIFERKDGAWVITRDHSSAAGG